MQNLRDSAAACAGRATGLQMRLGVRGAITQRPRGECRKSAESEIFTGKPHGLTDRHSHCVHVRARVGPPHIGRCAETRARSFARSLVWLLKLGETCLLTVSRASRSRYARADPLFLWQHPVIYVVLNAERSKTEREISITVHSIPLTQSE